MSAALGPHCHDWPPSSSCQAAHAINARDCYLTEANDVITCEIKLFQKYFSLRRRPCEIILFKRLETCLNYFEIIRDAYFSS